MLEESGGALERYRLRYNGMGCAGVLERYVRYRKSGGCRNGLTVWDFWDAGTVWNVYEILPD